MPLCSVHTTVTLNVASRSASAVSLEETPACHENQDYLNLFSWRSFTQTFPALSRKLVFFTACGRLWWVSGITDVRTHARTLTRLTHLIIACTRKCAHALKPDYRLLTTWSCLVDLAAPGQQGSLRGSWLLPASLCAVQPNFHGGGAGSSASCSVL